MLRGASQTKVIMANLHLLSCHPGQAMIARPLNLWPPLPSPPPSPHPLSAALSFQIPAQCCLPPSSMGGGGRGGPEMEGRRKFYLAPTCAANTGGINQNIGPQQQAAHRKILPRDYRVKTVSVPRIWRWPEKQRERKREREREREREEREACMACRSGAISSKLFCPEKFGFTLTLFSERCQLFGPFFVASHWRLEQKKKLYIGTAFYFYFIVPLCTGSPVVCFSHDWMVEKNSANAKICGISMCRGYYPVQNCQNMHPHRRQEKLQLVLQAQNCREWGSHICKSWSKAS